MLPARARDMRGRGMADEDENVEPEFVEEVEEVEEFDAEPDEAELDPEALEDEDFVVDEEDTFGTDDVIEDEDDEDETETAAESTARRTASADEDDDDDDMITPDDVEADLDTILKDRLVTADESEDEDDETESADDPRSDPGDRLQPKRPDELLCSHCFLLVRSKAPNCPMADDACPIFTV